MKKSALLFLFSCLAIAVSAQIRLPRLISSGMVLQRDAELKIWGWSSANEAITLSFKEKIYTAKADGAGNWLINLPKQKAGGPFAMQLKGKNEITLHDILIGDVWVCSGQSNMELWMGRLKYTYADEIASANNPNIRQFLVPDKYDLQSDRGQHVPDRVGRSSSRVRQSRFEPWRWGS